MARVKDANGTLGTGYLVSVSRGATGGGELPIILHRMHGETSQCCKDRDTNSGEYMRSEDLQRVVG